MVSFTTAFVLFTTSVATATHVVANPDGAIHELVARQTFDPSTLPQQCQDQCSSLLSSLSAPSCSSDIQCVCSKDIVAKLQQCAQCDASVVGQDAVASLYQKYSDACKAGGITVPGFPPSSSNSSGGASGGSSGGNAGSSGDNKGSGGAFSNLQISAAGVVVSAALAFMLAA